MDLRIVRRPVADLLSARSQCLFSLNTTAQRHESSYRRTKQKLNIGPEKSFLSSDISPDRDHIIFNPPSSAPSVLHTPIKFLPKEDKRRQLLEATAARINPTTNPLPPLIEKFHLGRGRHHLTQEDVNKIRELRVADPVKNSIQRLAKQYNCSVPFIKIISAEAAKTQETLKQHATAEREKLEAIRARWGKTRAMAREDRLKRKEIALRDE